MKTKTIILALAVSSLYFSNVSAQRNHHYEGNKDHGHKHGHSHHEKLSGKTFLIHYTNKDYKLTFLTDSTIKWADAGVKTTDGTVYALNKINRGIYIGSWEDKNEGGLSQVIDMHRKKVYTAKLNAGKKVINSVATIAEIVEPPVLPEQNKSAGDTKTPDKK